jgi:hypothetical protein
MKPDRMSFMEFSKYNNALYIADKLANNVP